MIDFYTWNTPNGRKLSIMFAETGLAYQLKPINIRKSEQKQPEFLKINPNGRIPALFDHETGQRVFESGAGLIYLAEKSGQFFQQSQKQEILSWLFWQAGGLGPMLGQYNHFKSLKDKQAYSEKHFLCESFRLLAVMECTLKEQPYLAGKEYSIADIMCYPWASSAMKGFTQSHPQHVQNYPFLQGWLNQIRQRPGVQQGNAVLAELSQSLY
ncbi:glutathione S-transferase family protein [Gayadomonas joobiniege]|uniref:glutathione S-transferase family protein n=1 Tax=Gayadomonas joobiniege TaxID=1234606 RepID=UPI00037ACA65|nr:glutathione binding-like protein [Gayadomonas joobiniege]